MRSGPARLLRVARRSMGRRNEEEVNGREDIAPLCAVWKAQRHVAAEWTSGLSLNVACLSGTVLPGSLRASRGEDSASPRNYSSSLSREQPSGAPTNGRHWSVISVALAREAETSKRKCDIHHWTCHCPAVLAEDRGSEGVNAPQH